MPGVGFCDLNPVNIFPAPHQFMEVSCSEFGQILFQQFEQIQGDVQGNRASVIL
jgi:hypothetical protein